MLELIKEIVKFVIVFFADNLIAVISLCISIVALVYTYKTNKKELEVVIEDNAFNIEHFTNESGKPLLFSPNEKGYAVIIIKVVNPSIHDIGFFDFVILDKSKPETNIIPVKKVNCYDPSSNSDFVYGYINGQSSTQLNLLESSYGIFKSNSFTRLDIPINIFDNMEYITVRFKVAIPSRKSVPHSIYRKKYKYFSEEVSLNQAGAQSTN